MTVPWLELGISVALAAGFACVGEIVLRRRSSALAAWNESFLAGMGACAAALFPLSLILPGRAVLATAALLLLASVWVVASRLVRRPAAPRSGPQPLDPGTRLVLGLAALVALCFAALNFRYNYAWDGFQIWASKAQLLSVRGSLTQRLVSRRRLRAASRPVSAARPSLRSAPEPACAAASTSTS